MPGTLVFAPGVRVLIDSAKHGIIDVSEDLTRGDLVLNQDAPHNLSLSIENPRRKYDGVFMPNDRIVVKMKRVRWLQLMAGYINSVPFASVWPRTVDISASCSLKRLLYTFYDPGSIAATNLMASFSTGGGVRGTTQPGTTGGATSLNSSADGDGNLAARAQAILEEVVNWPTDAIHIGRLPPTWWDKISDLYGQISPQLIAATPNIVNPNATIAGASLGGLDPDGDLVLTAEEVYKLLAATGWQGDDIIRMGGIVWRESNFKVNAYNNTAAGNGDHACGLFQMLWPLHGFDKDRMLSDPTYAAQQGYALWKEAGWAPWKGGPGEHNAAALALGEQKIRDAMNSVTNAPNTAMAERWSAAAQAAANGGAGTSAMSAQIPGAPNNLVFPVPGAGKAYDGTWGYTDDWGNPRSGGRTHKGHDIFAPKGTPILSMSDGVVDRTKDVDDGLSGLYVRIKDPLGNIYYYMHNEVNYVKEGDLVKAGQQIALVDNTGNAATTAAHCHFEWHPGGGDAVNPHALLNAAARVDVPGGAAGGSAPMFGAGAIFPTPDEVSSLLIGPRMLMNDTPVFNTIRDLLDGSMRSFCSAPNGDFIAWFPDYFGQYGLTASMTIEDIELLDFTIDWDDTRLITHQFVTGSVGGYNSTIPSDPNETLALMTQTMGVASIDFPEILEAILGEGAGDWTDTDALLQRFGARPAHTAKPAIISPEAEFFAAVHLFKAAWARQFTANVPISFMPELWPGMLMKIPSRGLQVYIEQVHHSWDFRQGGGFETRVQISSPASLNGKFAALPQAAVFAQGGGRPSRRSR